MNGNWNVKGFEDELENKVFPGRDKVLMVKEQVKEIMNKTEELRKKVDELTKRNEFKMMEVLEKINKNAIN